MLAAFYRYATFWSPGLLPISLSPTSMKPFHNLHWSHSRCSCPPLHTAAAELCAYFGDTLSPTSFSEASPTAVPESLFSL